MSSGDETTPTRNPNPETRTTWTMKQTHASRITSFCCAPLAGLALATALFASGCGGGTETHSPDDGHEHEAGHEHAEDGDAHDHEDEDK